MHKNVISLLLALVMLVSLTACGGGRNMGRLLVSLRQ